MKEKTEVERRGPRHVTKDKICDFLERQFIPSVATVKLADWGILRQY